MEQEFIKFVNFLAFTGTSDILKRLKCGTFEVHLLTSDYVYHVFILFGAFIMKNCKNALFSFTVSVYLHATIRAPLNGFSLSSVSGIFTKLF
jgi:hypothetical protein